MRPSELQPSRYPPAPPFSLGARAFVCGSPSMLRLRAALIMSRLATPREISEPGSLHSQRSPLLRLHLVRANPASIMLPPSHSSGAYRVVLTRPRTSAPLLLRVALTLAMPSQDQPRVYPDESLVVAITRPCHLVRLAGPPHVTLRTPYVRFPTSAPRLRSSPAPATLLIANLHPVIAGCDSHPPLLLRPTCLASSPPLRGRAHNDRSRSAVVPLLVVLLACGF